MQQNAVDQCENGRVNADAERQRDDREGSKSRRLPELTESKL
jgi:hypothetical protein